MTKQEAILIIKNNEKELNAYKVAELRIFAAAFKISKYHDLKKNDLISAINSEICKNNEIADDEHIARIKIGMIIAFNIPERNGRTVDSAMVKEIIYDDSGNVSKVSAETKYGRKYEVDRKDIRWVKTSRWPKTLLALLKNQK